MKNLFNAGDKKRYTRTVKYEDRASFESGTVHDLYSTFSIARDAEWCCRLFVLEMKEDDEEGIGTFVHVDHHGAALIGSEVEFEAEIYELKGNAINCKWNVTAKGRLIASGIAGQKILKKEKLEMIFDKLQNEQ
jgi:fluoroacetyl-CoA thioesterase